MYLLSSLLSPGNIEKPVNELNDSKELDAYFAANVRHPIVLSSAVMTLAKVSSRFTDNLLYISAVICSVQFLQKITSSLSLLLMLSVLLHCSWPCQGQLVMSGFFSEKKIGFRSRSQVPVYFVNISSLCGVKAFAGIELYCTGKAARKMYFDCLAQVCWWFLLI